MVLTTLLLRCLRNRFKETAIDMLTKEQYLPLLDNCDYIDKILAYPDESSAKRNFRNELAANKYDTVIDLQNSFSSRFITSTIKPRRLYRFKRHRINRWIRIHLPTQRHKLQIPPPVAIDYLNTASPLTALDDSKGLVLNVNTHSVIRIKELLSSYSEKISVSNEVKPLLLSPGARHPTKIWLAEHWSKLMQIAYEAGYKSQVLIGSKEDFKLLETIKSKIDFPVLNTAGTTSLSELVALVNSGSALISSDSGPMHIASAVNTPVVAIFGPTTPELGFAPFRCQSEIVQADELLTCRPCHPHGPVKCPRKHFRCMKDISPDIVFDALERVMRVA